jgi:hypothetical protein
VEILLACDWSVAPEKMMPVRRKHAEVIPDKKGS